ARSKGACGKWWSRRCGSLYRPLTGRTARWPCMAGFRSSLGIEPDRHRPVIDQRDLHVGAEDAVGDRHALRGDSGRKMLVEALALVGRGRGGEARPVAFGLRGERELADDE